MNLLKNIAVVLVCGSLSLCLSPQVCASLPLNVTQKAPTKPCIPTITNVEFRSDLTRVYVTLTGRPHTSYRIDFVRMILPSGKDLAFTDIDGIDAKRYFQWETDGVIDLEIDFPAVKAVNSFCLEFSGLDGEKLTASYSKKASKKSATNNKKK